MKPVIQIWLWGLILLLAGTLAFAAAKDSRRAQSLAKSARYLSAKADRALSLVQHKITHKEPLTAAEKQLFGEQMVRSRKPHTVNPLDNTGGPDGSGYAYMDNVAPDTATYAWIELCGDNLASDGPTGDDESASADLGFNFPFYGTNYNSCYITTNGVISFGGEVGGLGEFSAMDPGSTEPQYPYMAPFWVDMNTFEGTGSGCNSDNAAPWIRYKSVGVAPNQYFVVEWRRMPEFSTGTLFSFEAILYGNGKVKFQYHDTDFTLPTQGFRNFGTGLDAPGAENGLTYWFFNGDNNSTIGQAPDVGRSIWFVQPNGIPQSVTNFTGTATGTNVTLTWTDPTHDTNGNPLTIDSVLIYRGLPGQQMQIGSLVPGVQSFTALNEPQGNLVYWARAKVGQWLSPWVSVPLIVGNPSYVSDFEDNDGGWLADNNVWVWGAPTNPNGPQPHSGANLWGTGLAADYEGGECGYINFSPDQEVASPNATVEFWAWYQIENMWDGCNFQVSVDGGGTWEIVSPLNGYPSLTNGEWGCGGEDSVWAMWAEFPEWQYIVVPIGQYLGQTPMFRFKFGSDPIVNYAGFFLDDMTIWGLAPHVDGTPLPVSNAQGSSGGTTTVTFTWTDPDHDTNGNPLTIDSVLIYRGDLQPGSQIDHVAGGAQTYVGSDQPQGTVIYFLRAKAGTLMSMPVRLTVVVGSPTYTNGFELDDGGWVADNTVWAWGAPTNPDGPVPHDGANCWGAGMFANYDNSACGHLDLNLGLEVISPGATLEFWYWYQTEQSWDGCNVKVSVDDGANWEIVTPLSGYPGTTNGEWACTGEEPVWTGWPMDPQWRFALIPLGQYIGQTPIFRFTFGSDPLFNYAGFFLDDVVIWGLHPPQSAPVSGTVTLNGGHGDVTQTAVTANGLGAPLAHPAADGSFTLATVQVGNNRRILGSLAGYETDTVSIVLDSTGYTGVDLVLRRQAPPAPVNLVGWVKTAARKDSLRWTMSPDTMVDGYKLYRKLTTQPDYTYRTTIWGRTSQWVNDTLEAYGIYNYVVTAIDTNVIIAPWAESGYSDAVTHPFGHQAPINLTADGNFDNKVHLSWNSPTDNTMSFLSYDNGSNDVEGMGWWSAQPEFGWIVAHYDGEGPLSVSGIRAYLTQLATPGAPIQLGVFADDGSGHPSANPLVVMDATVEAPLNAMHEWTLARPVGIESGSFFVGIRQMTNRTLGLGGDNYTPFITSTFFYNFDGSTWDSFEPHLLAVPMLSARVIGGLAEQNAVRAPLAVRKPVNASGFLTKSSTTVKALTAPAAGKVTVPAKGDRMAVTMESAGKVLPNVAYPEVSLGADLPHLMAIRLRNSVGPHAPMITAASPTEHGHGGMLDDIRKYMVYMDNNLIDSTVFPTSEKDVLNLVENVAHNFTVKARYDDDSLSLASNVVNARCNMAPAAPTGVVVTPIGDTQMRITWDDPTVNMDNTPCTDLAGLRVYRDDVLITTTPVTPGVHQYTDTPPDPMVVYTWTVKAIDEVPNEGDGGSASGSVVSPWHTVDYEWIDISTQGQMIVDCDDCNQGPFDLGFDMTFYGNTYSQVSVSSNGFVEFVGMDAWAGWCPPETWPPNSVIYLMAEDLDPSNNGSGDVYYYSDVPNGRCIISWNHVQAFGQPGTDFSMQIVLEDNGGVTLTYQSVSNTNGITGVENADGTDGISLWCQGDGPWQPQASSAVQFWGGPRQSILGTVRHQGAGNLPLPGVWVRAGVDSVQTDANGYYQIPLDPATYTVYFRHPTHCDSVRANRVLQPGINDTLNVSLYSPAIARSSSSLTFVVNRNTQQSQTFVLSDTGACPLTYLLSDSVTWLAATPQSGVINPDDSVQVTVTVSPGLMQPADYQANLWIIGNAPGSPMSIHVDMMVLRADELPGLPPSVFALHANYPNPFNPATLLPFDVAQQSQVDIIVYNVMGQEVARPVSGVYSAGRYQAHFDGKDLPSGLYLVKMTAGSFTSTGKMMLLK